MPLLLDQFVQRLVDSGLMAPDAVEALPEKLPADKRPQTGEDVAKLLYRRGVLTKYQAEAVYRGKTKGLVLGNYVVLDKIGQGGMGAVYRARNRRMDREVALKRDCRGPFALDPLQIQLDDIDRKAVLADDRA